MFDAWVNVLMYELWTYKWTNVRRISHLPINLCFQCTMSMCKTYELWTNEFCTIFIIKSWDAKFVMIGILNYIKLYKLWTIWLCSNYMIIWLYVIVFGGTTTPILFQWLVSRIFFISVPSFHDIIILIFTSLLLVLVYIHSRGFICSMNKTKMIILVRVRPILLPSIIRKNSPQTRVKNTFF